MSPIDDMIQNPSSVMTLVGGILATASFASAAGILVPKFAEKLIPKVKSTRLGDQFPYEYVDGDGVIHGKDGLKFVIIAFDGANLRFNEANFQRFLAVTRKAWLEDMGRSGIRVRVAFIRDRLPLGLSDDHPIPLMQTIAAQWNATMPTALSTELYAILSIRDSRDGAGKLVDVARRTVATMQAYKPVIMGTPGNPSPTEYLARQIAPISRPRPANNSRSTTLGQRLASDAMRRLPNDGVIEFASGMKKKYAAVFVVEDWASLQREATMLDLLTTKFEMAVIHDFAPIPQAQALSVLAYQSRFSATLNPLSSAAEQFSEVQGLLEKNSNDEETLLRCQTTIIAYADEPSALKAIHSRLLEYTSQGINVAWTNWNCVGHWFAQFPGFDAQARGMRLTSGECAILSTLQATPKGKADSEWGKGPVAVFETLDGSPYRLQLHVGGGDMPLGHFVMIAPSGSGKTTLATYIGASACRHDNVKAFFFDRLRGCEVATRALGGKYLNFQGSAATSFNPLQLADTSINRAFLRDWLELIGDVNSDNIAQAQEIADAVETVFERDLPMEFRNLKGLRELAFQSELRQKLVPWTSDNNYGAIFCAPVDTLDLGARIIGLDFTSVLDDERLAPAAVTYVMHRIIAEAAGQPRYIFIDETEPMLRNKSFQQRYRTLLQEGRKKRLIVGSAFQRPTAVAELGMGDVIRGQCPTVFFFRNPQARDEDFEAWNLNDQELRFVRGETFADRPYAVLLKRYGEEAGGESVLLNVDLSRLGKYLKVFTSSTPSVLLAERLWKQHGDKFVDAYLDAA